MRIYREGLGIDRLKLYHSKIFDSKTPCRPFISAQISELGITLASKTTDEKSNEIPAVQELIRELDIAGCMVVADAMHCQQETAEEIIHGKGDYLFSVKGNQPTPEKEIADYVNDNQLSFVQ